jgi:hypothetical protein
MRAIVTVPIEETDLLNRTLRSQARLALPAMFLVLLPTTALAQQAPAAQAQQREHVVRRGDTLWDLARAYLDNPFLWPMIYEANRDVVRNPHWIYPANRLIIPPVLQRAAAPEGEPIREVALPPLEMPAAFAAQDTTPTVLATLDMRRPVLSEGEYLRLPWLSATADPGTTGRILSLMDGGTEVERIAPAVYPNDRVYVSMTGRTVLEGDTLLVVRAGRRMGSWGTVVEPLALLHVDSVVSGAVTAHVVSQFGEVRVGDFVMPRTPLPAIGAGAPVPVATGPEGQIVQFLYPASLHGTTDLAFVSLGRSHGLGIGDELAVYVPAGRGLPPTQVAVLRTVRAGEQTSTVRVISVTSTALRDGLPVRVVRQMP